jgi:hypothetical protein
MFVYAYLNMLYHVTLGYILFTFRIATINSLIKLNDFARFPLIGRLKCKSWPDHVDTEMWMDWWSKRWKKNQIQQTLNDYILLMRSFLVFCVVLLALFVFVLSINVGDISALSILHFPFDFL